MEVGVGCSVLDEWVGGLHWVGEVGGSTSSQMKEAGVGGGWGVWLFLLTGPPPPRVSRVGGAGGGLLIGCFFVEVWWLGVAFLGAGGGGDAPS